MGSRVRGDRCVGLSACRDTHAFVGRQRRATVTQACLRSPAQYAIGGCWILSGVLGYWGIGVLGLGPETLSPESRVPSPESQTPSLDESQAGIDTSFIRSCEYVPLARSRNRDAARRFTTERWSTKRRCVKRIPTSIRPAAFAEAEAEAAPANAIAPGTKTAKTAKTAGWKKSGEKRRTFSGPGLTPSSVRSAGPPGRAHRRRTGVARRRSPSPCNRQAYRTKPPPRRASRAGSDASKKRALPVGSARSRRRRDPQNGL
ncbi:Uncharacterised protein [Burkholderia pseudomallei]|nr:Uncharacterised protein [Burkholderia pseudomallei]CAJ4781982.1 Uncharacterised protein [Burkholderia pseudomallei]